MLIIRSPLRISLGGGGTDLPSYYSKFESNFLAAAIDKYVYVSINRPFSRGIYLKYSNYEQCASIDDIKHPLIRECLRVMSLTNPQIEISSVADIPAGTGLGSSGSFTSALLKGLHEFLEIEVSRDELAELACKVEIEILGDPVGKQDQYISVFGGIKSFHISREGTVNHQDLNVTGLTRQKLEDNLTLFYTGSTRKASTILIDQKNRANDIDLQANLHLTKLLGLRSREALESGDLLQFAQLLTEQWNQKRSRSLNASSDLIDGAIKKGLEAGALGGKLIGAGGGGFLLFYSEEKDSLRLAMSEMGLEETRFCIEDSGTEIVSG